MVDAKAFENAIPIQKEFEEQFADAPGVRGIGLGVNSAETAPAINVQVETAAAGKKLPQSFHNLDVVVDVVGDVTAY